MWLAVKSCPDIKSVIMVTRTGADVNMKKGRDFRYEDELATVGDDCPAEPMNAEDPLFILLYQWFYGQTEGASAHNRRVFEPTPP